MSNLFRPHIIHHRPFIFHHRHPYIYRHLFRTEADTEAVGEEVIEVGEVDFIERSISLNAVFH